jgi:bisphosphoglycerate-independent phosphoglycerate mutase (AlkP superfamily)
MVARPPVAALIIFDGWGIRAAEENNAIAHARTPVMTKRPESRWACRRTSWAIPRWVI